MTIDMTVRTDRESGNLAVYAGWTADGKDGALDKFQALFALADEAEDWRDGTAALLPWSDEVVGKLKECAAPGREWWPFYRDYDPPLVEGQFAPMPHQLETAAFLAEHRRAYCTSTMRTGKTASTVMAFDYLRKTGRADSAMVVCPVSVMEGVWARTFRQTCPDLKVTVVRGTAAKRRKILDEDDADVLVVNYDGLKLLEAWVGLMFRTGRLNVLVIDELSHYGNSRSQRWKSADRIVNPFKEEDGPEYVWALTGTPAADVMAVYGYATLVNPAAMPWKTWTGWQTAVQTRWGAEAWMWRDRPDAPEKVREALQPNIRFNKEEVLKDLPPVTRTRLEAPLTKEQAGIFDGLKREMIALTEKDKIVKADRKAELVTKLFQVAAGGVIASEGATTVDARHRNGLILELVRDNVRKSVIFCAYRAVVDQLARFLEGEGVQTAAVHGSVTGTARDRIFDEFQNSEKYRVLVAHPVTTAYGTELAAADQLIINGPLMSGTHTYMQGLERLSSARQTSGQVSVVEIVSSPEEALFMDALDGRTGQAEATAKLFEYVTGR
ncbi:MAG: DEAD/DEAH box helicase [Deltaproteobacteria bacterium]|jgi:SNF2 family DNA or RNA helicase|nr:DEAD/DEAH box helicase [Deltaproteobacteria bacterium]